ncbi:hypothetical protein HMPREF1986_01903 [Oribacterium sp. oral taxon 078 str. F0263]|nr:hypothetical protein HMPREF1986_01903 [Oribacterium sp. oral taxon 078 str. F0263]
MRYCGFKSFFQSISIDLLPFVDFFCLRLLLLMHPSSLPSLWNGSLRLSLSRKEGSGGRLPGALPNHFDLR